MTAPAGIRGVGGAGSVNELLSVIKAPMTETERRAIREHARAVAYLVECRARDILAPDGPKLSTAGRMALAYVIDQAGGMRETANGLETCR
jgi:hypothetical protein